MTRRALLLIVFLGMTVGVAGTGSAHALLAESGTGRADAATTVARHAYDVGLQHARTLRAPATNLTAGNADRDRERTQISELQVASASAAKAGGAGSRLGDDVYATTKAGNSPAWSTVRARHWKNTAADPKLAGQWDEANLARMQSGRAPQRWNPDKGGMESMESNMLGRCERPRPT